MTRKTLLTLAAMAGMLCFTGVKARGAALIDVSILGTDPTQGENTLSSSLAVKPGDTIDYEVELKMAPLGTTSSNSHTITSLVSGTDGVTGLSFNLADSSVTWSSFTLASVFDQGLASNGTLIASSGVTDAFGSIGVTGVPQGVASGGNAGVEVIVGSGTLTIGTGGSSVTAAYSTTTGGFKINNAGFKPSVTSGDTNGYFGFSPLVFTSNPIISLTTSTPSSYGSSLGTLALVGGNGDYTPAVVKFTGMTSGYVTVDPFSPSTDNEVFALDVQGASSGQITDIINDIDNSGISGLSASLTGSAALPPLFTDGGTIVFLEDSPGIGATPSLGFDLANDSHLGGVTITGVAAIPEPATLSLMGLSAWALLARRRRKVADESAPMA